MSNHQLLKVTLIGRKADMQRRRRTTMAGAAIGLFDGGLAHLELGPDRLNPPQHLGAQLAGHRFLPAVLVHQSLDRFLEAVLAQARTALVEMLVDLRVSRAL